MKIYIALLRGINVGGKNIIRMADLKRMFERIGLFEVQTYIQSGNVLFRSEEEEESLRSKIEQEILIVFQISVTVVLRTFEELEKIILNCPFTDEEVAEADTSSQAESLYVSLMTHVLPQEKREYLSIYENEFEKYRIIGREIFLLFHQGIRNSKLANSLQKLGVPATVRNWKTIGKLVELAKNMEAGATNINIAQ